FGGNGYVDDGVMGRLFREAPVNSIWEGSGKVMCLDVMRAIGRDPAAAMTLLEELAHDGGDDARIRAELKGLQTMLAEPPEHLEALGRRFTERLVLVAQACLLRRHAPTAVADAFVQTRLDPDWGRVVGSIDIRNVAVDALLERAYPA
ncbi:MAG: DNA alkylation response protein, partial [Burkholderiales bacterium]|nr:DNA alkylation response protein [Burkholderiales bacterium]